MRKRRIPSSEMTPNQRRGRKSKTKGKVFEREIVNRLRKAGIPAKRGWAQSMGGSRIPDVIVEGLWLECGDGVNMDPRKKLAQAIADVATHAPESKHFNVIPFAITHQKGCRSVEVTGRIRDWTSLWRIADSPFHVGITRDALMTIDFENFVVMVKKICFPGDVDMGEDPSDVTSNSKGWKVKGGKAVKDEPPVDI